MCLTLEALGIEVEVHHHEVANAGQCEIGVQVQHPGAEGRRTADPEVRHQERRAPQRQDRHLHAQAARRRQRQRHARAPVAGQGRQEPVQRRWYGGLSQMALWYIGGIFKHARAINAFTNSTTNSYKRLVPGFEAPVMLAYSARNRSASMPHSVGLEPEGAPHRSALPGSGNSGYLTFAALMMAGLDGIKNKIDPGAPSTRTCTTCRRRRRS
jgi:glutamine synthetase